MKKVQISSPVTNNTVTIRKKRSTTPSVDPTKPNPPIMGYHSVCFYSLAGSDYPEENHCFTFTAITLQELLDKITNYHNKHYLSDSDYINVTPIEWGTIHNSHGGPLRGNFKATYIFGPAVTYYIYIHPIYKDDLNIEWNF